jgi:hypothetical protein
MVAIMIIPMISHVRSFSLAVSLSHEARVEREGSTARGFLTEKAGGARQTVTL